MPELIYKQSALSVCKEYGWIDDEDFIDGYNTAIKDISEAIKELPTVESEPARRGEWVETEPDEDDRKLGIEFSIKCSICHDENSHLDFNENSEIIGKTFWKSRFCPNCGAKMNNHIADVSKKVGDDSGK